jgi:hypothetical protein
MEVGRVLRGLREQAVPLADGRSMLIVLLTDGRWIVKRLLR